MYKPNQSFKQFLIKSFFILASGTFLSQVIQILAYPFITRFFTPEDFGLKAFFLTVITIAVGFSTVLFVAGSRLLSVTIANTSSSNLSPYDVISAPDWYLLNREMLNSSSSFLIERLIVGCVTPSSCAAALKLPVLATAANICKSLHFTNFWSFSCLATAFKWPLSLETQPPAIS